MKRNKFVGLAALFLTLGMVGCGETKTDDPVCETHKWGTKEILKDATCIAEGQSQRTCTVCGAKEDVKTISKKSHTYVDDTAATGNKAATCTEKGNKVQKCSVCGETKNVEIPMAEHTYGDTVWTSRANCTEAGAGKQTCTVCGHEEDVTEDALGHTYAKDDDGNDIVDWTGEGYGHATCEAAGKGHKACTRCNEVADVPEEKLEHNFQLVGDPTPRPDGSDKATVNMYSCDRGCNATSFGFQANEVTQRSVSKLVIGEDGGARFWGRPIGNDVQLSEDGSPDESSHDAVFNKEQLGDFFEYEFDLTAEQVATMGDTQRLYCEATAAQWMSNNNMDFWACKSGDTDWTRGMYIETTDTHNEGEDIDTYRYILYVDDQPKDFDSRIEVPAKSYTVKAEYVLPYDFHLHEGTNKIRLVMAGGYRSVFYKFTFRPYTPEAPVDPVDPTPVHTHSWTAGSSVVKEGESTYTVDTCACGKARVNLNVADLDNQLTKGGKLGSNGATARYAFTSSKAINGELYVKGTVDNANNYNYGFFTGKNGGSSAVTLPDGKTNTTFKLGETVIPAPVEKTYKELGMTGTNEAGAATFKVGDVALAEGLNTLTITRNDSFGIQYYEIFVVVDAKDLKQNITDVKVWEGKEALDAELSHDYDNSKTDYVRVDTTKFRKEDGSGTGSVIGFSGELTEARGDLKLFMKTKARTDQAKDNLFGAVANDSGVGYISDGNGGWTHPTDYRLVVRVNGNAVSFVADTKGGSATDWYLMDLAAFDVVVGKNTIELEGVAGYRQDIYGIKLASVSYSL